MAKKRRGRSAKYVVDYKGKPVVGLSYNKTLGQYYNTHYKTETKGSRFILAVTEMVQFIISEYGYQIKVERQPL